MKDLGRQLCEQYLNESAVIGSFIAGTIGGMALYKYFTNLFRTDCKNSPPKSSQYARCMFSYYNRLAKEFATRSQTDCSHFESRENCQRKLEDASDHFYALAGRWKTLADERLADEEEQKYSAAQLNPQP